MMGPRMDDAVTGPEYPNSPLTGVVFEIRFPGEPTIECHRDEFFKIARSEFPQVFVPTLKAGAAAALSPYQFRSQDGSVALLTALNLFAYQTNDYRGWDHFKPEVLRWIEAFAKLFPIGRLTRTGLRYTNIIRYAPGEVFPVANFLDIEMRLGTVRSTSFGRFSLSTVIPTEAGGQLTVQVQEVQNEEEQPAILLDFDYSMTENLDVGAVESYLENSHTETKRLFEGLLTGSYREFLRGEGLE